MLLKTDVKGEKKMDNRKESKTKVQEAYLQTHNKTRKLKQGVEVTLLRGCCL